MRRIITRTGTATALCMAFTLPGPLPGAAVAHATGPSGLGLGSGAGSDGKGPHGADGSAAHAARAAGRARGTADRLFREAARATERYEAARRAVKEQRRKVTRLNKAVRAKHRRLVALRNAVGRMAATQYRSGTLGPTASLMLADSPEELLDKVFLMDKGERAAANLYHRVEEAEQRLESERGRRTTALADLTQELKRQRRARRQIEAKLERAQARLERLETAEAARSRSSGCARRERTTALSLSADGKPLGGRRWKAPVAEHTVTSGFAQAGEHWARRHTGIDLAVDEGSPVGSVGYGTVYEVGCDDAFGNSVTVRHDEGRYTFYAHLSEVRAEPGERVFPGQHIGLAGSTGNSTGPHLHFEVRVTPQYGSAIDPEPWLREKGVVLRRR